MQRAKIETLNLIELSEDWSISMEIELEGSWKDHPGLLEQKKCFRVRGD